MPCRLVNCYFRSKRFDSEDVYCLQIHFGKMKGAREQTVACERDCCGQKYLSS
jgi:hypothetical protein